MITGRIVDVRRGRVVTGQGGELAFTEITVEVDRVLSGAIDAAVVLLEVDAGLLPGIDAADRTSPIAGQSTVLFLHRKLDMPDRYRPVSQQGAFAIVGDRVVPAESDALTESIAAAGFGALEADVEGVAFRAP